MYMRDPIILTTCRKYMEDPVICDDMGEPKGQCALCGCKYYEHNLSAFRYGSDDFHSAKQIQAERGIQEKFDF